MIQVDGSTYRKIGDGFYACDTVGGVTFVWKESTHEECAVKLANGECYLRYQHLSSKEQLEIEGSPEFGGDACFRGRARFNWTRQPNELEWSDFLHRFQPEVKQLKPPPPSAPESFRSGNAPVDLTQVELVRGNGSRQQQVVKGG